jgi:predicted Zn-dependent protease
VRWDHIVWGYIKMGRLADARTLAARVSSEQPDNGPIMEARGYVAAMTQDYGEAVASYSRAVELRPRSYLAHYNLAKALLKTGDKSRAAEEARAAMRLNPSPDSKALLTEIEAAP